MTRLLCCLAAVLVFGCEEGQDSLQAGDGGSSDGSNVNDSGTMADGGTVPGDGSIPDVEGPACRWTMAQAGRPILYEGRTTADGCNECECPSGSIPPQEGIPCTAAFCMNGPARCSGHADCEPRGYCHFDPGCTGELGYCANIQSRCGLSRTGGIQDNPAAPASQSDGVFCGCDGVTYVGEECFGRPWARRGPC